MAVQSGATPLGAPLPELTLPDPTGEQVHLPELRPDNGVLVVVFACNHCPYVRHVERELAAVQRRYADQEVAFVAIMSNDIETYPDDDAPGMLEQKERAGWQFPYLMDLDQNAALTFGAVCTPDFFVYGRDGALAYRGAFDASSPKNGEPLTGEALDQAIAAALVSQPVPQPHRPAMGCGIKWRPGNEPEAVSFL